MLSPPVPILSERTVQKTRSSEWHYYKPPYRLHAGQRDPDFADDHIFGSNRKRLTRSICHIIEILSIKKKIESFSSFGFLTERAVLPETMSVRNEGIPTVGRVVDSVSGPPMYCGAP